LAANVLVGVDENGARRWQGGGRSRGRGRCVGAVGEDNKGGGSGDIVSINFVCFIYFATLRTGLVVGEGARRACTPFFFYVFIRNCTCIGINTNLAR